MSSTTKSEVERMITKKMIYDACLRSIQKMGAQEFKKASWFAWKRNKLIIGAVSSHGAPQP